MTPASTTTLHRYLDLSDRAPIAEGKRRLVFEHPGDPQLLVKVMKPGSHRDDGQPLRRKRFKLRRREGVFAYFTRELLEYVAVRVSNRVPPAALPVSAVYGLVETNLGLGLVVEKVTDGAGALAPTLESLLATGRFDPERRALLADFFDALVGHHVVAYELNADNIVLAGQRGNAPRFVCIDGMGSRTLIPLQAWLPRLNARKIRRHQKRIEAQLPGAG